MTKMKLYRFQRSGGGTTVSPKKPDCDYTELFRLIADEGCVLTDGTSRLDCVDTDDGTVWREESE